MSPCILVLILAINDTLYFSLFVFYLIFHFYPLSLRPELYCRCLRPSVQPSVRQPVRMSIRLCDQAWPRDNMKYFSSIFEVWLHYSSRKYPDTPDHGYHSSLSVHIIDQKVNLTFFIPEIRALKSVTFRLSIRWPNRSDGFYRVSIFAFCLSYKIWLKWICGLVMTGACPHIYWWSFV